MSPDRLSATFSALADPTRRAILARLAQGETSVAELAAPFAISAPAVTKHLKVLQRAGLITQGRQAQWRPCRLEAAPLQEAADFIEQYRRFWEQRLDRLGDYLQTLQAAQPAQEEKGKNGSKKRRRDKRPPAGVVALNRRALGRRHFLEQGERTWTWKCRA